MLSSPWQFLGKWSTAALLSLSFVNRKRHCSERLCCASTPVAALPMAVLGCSALLLLGQAMQHETLNEENAHLPTLPTLCLLIKSERQEKGCRTIETHF